MPGTKVFITALLLMTVLTPAHAKLEVSLITVGPGGELFEAFGHSALRVRDTTQKTEADVYEFRGLSANALARGNMLGNFLAAWQGKSQVALATVSLGDLRARYARPNDRRELRLEALRLNQKQARRLLADLKADMATGRYNYGNFNSNCATRLRDRLFAVLPAATRNKLDASSDETYRTIVRRAIDTAAARHGGVSLPIDTFARGAARVQATSMMNHLGIPKVLRSGEELESTLKKIDPLVSFIPNLYAAFQQLTTVELVRPLTVYETLATPERLRDGLRLVKVGKQSLLIGK